MYASKIHPYRSVPVKFIFIFVNLYVHSQLAKTINTQPTRVCIIHYVCSRRRDSDTLFHVKMFSEMQLQRDGKLVDIYTLSLGE